MGDGPVTPPTPPSPPTPSNVPGSSVDVQKYVPGLDLKKVDPRDKKTIDAINRAVTFGLSRESGGFTPARKHLIAGLSQWPFNAVNVGTAYCADISVFIGAAVGTVPGFSPIGYCFQGDGVTDRLGRSIKVHHMTVRMDINWDSTAGTGAPAGGAANIEQYGNSFGPLRIIIFKDKESLAAAPTSSSTTFAIGGNTTQLFLGMTAAANVLQNLNAAPYNPVTHGYRYEIMHDEVISAPSNATVITYGANGATFCASARTHHRIHLPLGFDVEFADDNANGTTTILRNNIFIGWYQPNDLITQNTCIVPYVTGSTDVLFTDS